MRKNLLRKMLLSVVLTGTLIGSAACGEQGTQTVPEVTGEAIGGTSVPEQETTGASQPMETESGVSSEAENTGDVKITLEDFEGGSSPEDKERSYTYTYQMPTVTIPGNEEAQNKIENDLTAYVERFVNEINNSDFGTIYADEMTGVQSYQNLTLQVLRADDKVISLVWGNEGYNQGAHGWYLQSYVNYFTQTGEKITFDSLGSGFREKALELVTEKAAVMQAEQDCFYPDYEDNLKMVVLDGTEDLDILYQEIYGADAAGTASGFATPTFGITEDGFIFESGQYVLQPYAVGIVDFEISAAEMGDALTADIFE